MKPISQVIGTMPAMSIAQPLRIDSEQIASFVNAVFDQLKSIFPAWSAAWKTQGDIDNAKKIWIIAFAENGITTKKQVSLGLKACRSLKTDFLPSIGKFIELCKPTPENLGLPDPETAFKTASMRLYKPLHPVLEATIKEVDSYDLRCGRVSFKQFEYVYMNKVNCFANGEPLTKKVNSAITNQSDKPKGLEAINITADQAIEKRIAEQGISKNAKEARAQALAMLGLKDRKNG